MKLLGDPILSQAEAAAWETKLFEKDEVKEWAAMQQAGNALARAVVRDFAEIGAFPAAARLLVLVGKGHNGGDALIAAQALLARFPAAQADVLMAFGERSLRPLARRAFRALLHVGSRRATVIAAPLPETKYDLSLDGIFGFQFRPPATPAVLRVAERINALAIRFRAAVDLPSGGIVRADFTYATGIAKTELLGSAVAGRPRLLDLGFFPEGEPGLSRVLTGKILAPLATWRTPASDKRTYGHVFLLGGSRNFPGALLMSVSAALKSGVGLVTAFVPESLVAAFAARAPEAMWVGWPETPEGNLALEGQPLLLARLERATALVIGPGLGREAESLALVVELVKKVNVPVLLDADALQAKVVAGARTPLVLTPHAGEFSRLAAGGDEKNFVAATGAVLVLKGPTTRIVTSSAESVAPAANEGPAISDGRGPAETSAIATYHAFAGGPVLARGGSGDLLAGLIGGLLAQTPTEPVLAACRGVMWHGLAADLLARAHGQTAVQITQLLEFLPAALRRSTEAD